MLSQAFNWKLIQKSIIFMTDINNKNDYKLQHIANKLM